PFDERRGAPGLEAIAPQAPEKGREWRRIRVGPAYRQDPGHAVGAEVALLERIRRKRCARGPGHVGPQGAVGQHGPARAWRRQWRTRAERVDDQIEIAEASRRPGQ